MVQFAENSADLRISSASLDGDGALSDGRHANIGGKYLADALAPAQAVEPRFSDYDGIVFAAFNLAKTRVHIAAQVPYVKIRPRVTQLGLPQFVTGRLDENDFSFHVGDVKKLFADEFSLPFGE